MNRRTLLGGMLASPAILLPSVADAAPPSGAAEADGLTQMMAQDIHSWESLCGARGADFALFSVPAWLMDRIYDNARTLFPDHTVWFPRGEWFTASAAMTWIVTFDLHKTEPRALWVLRQLTPDQYYALISIESGLMVRP